MLTPGFGLRQTDCRMQALHPPAAAVSWAPGEQALPPQKASVALNGGLCTTRGQGNSKKRLFAINPTRLVNFPTFLKVLVLVFSDILKIIFFPKVN